MKVSLPFIMTFLLYVNNILSQNVINNSFTTNAVVNSLSVYGDTLFMGGEFTKVYTQDSSRKYGILTDAAGNLNFTWPQPDNTINTVIPDNKKGFYIAGNFEHVGDSTRSKLAHIDSLGRVGSLFSNIKFNGEINALQLINDTLYVGGNFTGVGNTIRSSLSMIDSSGSFKTDMTPIIVPTINVIIPDGKGGWYVGGSFQSFDKLTRIGVAQIDKNGMITSWISDVLGNVKVLLKTDSILYIGGSFLSVQNQYRNNLASVSLQTGEVTNWNPNVVSTSSPNFSSVTAIEVYGNQVFIGGNFDLVNGLSRIGFASIDVYSGIPNSLSLSVSSVEPIYCMKVKNDMLYIGGGFYSLASQTRNNVAKFNLLSSTLTTWNPNANSRVYSIDINDTIVYLGGAFTIIGGQGRSYLAAVHYLTGMSTSWNIQANNIVKSVLLKSDTLFVGGQFTQIGGITRYYFASVSAKTSTVYPLNLNPNNHVYTISNSNGKLLIGGIFTETGGVTRSRIASISLVNNILTSFAPPHINLPVKTIAVYGSTIFAGGDFYLIGSSYQYHLAALNRYSGGMYTWPYINSGYRVNTILLKGNKLYIGGEFSNIGGSPRSNIAIMDANSGAILNWNPTFNDEVSVIAQSGKKIWVGGRFTVVNGVARVRICELDSASGSLNTWYPLPDGPINSIYSNGSTLYVGGEFANIGFTSRANIASFDTTTGFVTSWNPGSTDAIACISGYADRTYIGGDFIGFGGVSRNYLAALSLSTNKILRWNPGANNFVKKMIISNSKLYVSGLFTNLASNMRPYVGRFQLPATTLSNWNPNVNATVNCFAFRSNKVILGGLFTTVNSVITSRYKICEVDTGTALVSGWNPSINFSGEVKSVNIGPNSIFIGGTFTNIGSIFRSNLAEVDPITATATTWNPGPNGIVNNISIIGNNLYIGGNFSTFSGISSTKLVKVNVNSKAPINIYGSDAEVTGLYPYHEKMIVSTNSRYIIGNKLGNIVNVLDTTKGNAYNWNLPFGGKYGVFPIIRDLVLTENAIFLAGNIEGFYYNPSRYVIKVKGPVVFSVTQLNDTLFCPGDSIVISFSYYPSADSGNIFTVQAVSSNGSIYSLASVPGINNHMFRTVLPLNIPNDVYDIRIIATSPLWYSSNSIKIKILNRITNNVVSPFGPACIGVPANISASLPNQPPGGSVIYNWLSGTSASGPFNTGQGIVNTQNYITPSLFQNYWFKRVVNYGGCSDTSLPISVTPLNANIWTGYQSNDWGNSGNWSCNRVPNNSDSVVIGSSINQAIIFDRARVARCVNILSSGQLSLIRDSSELKIYGSLYPSGTLNNIAGEIQFGGTQNQLIPGGNYNRIRLMNPAGASIDGILFMNDSFILEQGKLYIGNFNLYLNGKKSIVYSSNNTSFIVNNGFGFIIIDSLGPTGRNGTVLLPIGPNDTSFNPIWISNIGVIDQYAIRVFSGVSNTYFGNYLGTLLTANAVNKTWFLNEGVAGGGNLSISVQWAANHELPGFNRNLSYLSYYKPGSWYAGSSGIATGSSPYTRTRSGITTQLSGTPVSVGSSGTLPVSLVSFKAKQKDNNALIEWVTSSELNNAKFLLQKAEGNNHFKTLYEVKGKGNTLLLNYYSYNDFDAWVNKNIVFYRLNQIDIDGSSKISNIIQLEINHVNSPDLEIFPNPFCNYIQIEHPSIETQDLTFQILNFNGSILSSDYFNITGKGHITTLHTTNLLSGIYVLKIKYSESVRYFKIMKY